MKTRAAPRRRIRPRAFTLIELLAVIVILGILVSIVTWGAKQGLDKASQTRCMGNLKELHKTVTMFMLDEERRLQAADPPDFPTDDQLGKDYASGDAGYPYSIISYYGGGTVDKLRCPAVRDGSLGYALNANLFNASRKAVDQGGTRIDYTELENSNILLYDANPDKTPANRHGGKCYGITIFGDIDRDVTNADLQNKND